MIVLCCIYLKTRKYTNLSGVKLGPLVEYDRAHDTQLLETLEALIQNHNSRKLAAESLFLHRNTMVHRINKIEEVLHCSLDDTEIMEQLEFAIKMKMYAH